MYCIRMYYAKIFGVSCLAHSFTLAPSLSCLSQRGHSRKSAPNRQKRNRENSEKYCKLRLILQSNMNMCCFVLYIHIRRTLYLYEILCIIYRLLLGRVANAAGWHFNLHHLFLIYYIYISPNRTESNTYIHNIQIYVSISIFNPSIIILCCLCI